MLKSNNIIKKSLVILISLVTIFTFSIVSVDNAFGYGEEYISEDYSYYGPTPIQYLAMECLCIEYPDKYNHGFLQNDDITGMSIDELLDNDKYSWFGDSKITGDNKYLDGLKLRDLYNQELRGWKIGDAYRDDWKGFYAIGMINESTNDYVFVIKNSDPLIGQFFRDWVANDFPLYFDQNDGPQLDLADKYFKQFLETVPQSSGEVVVKRSSSYRSLPRVSLTGHSLGAGLSIYLSAKYNYPAIVFDAVPMLDVAYYRRPYEMGANYGGYDYWSFVDFLNEDDICAGVWECKYKNYVPCRNHNSTGLPAHAHAMETILNKTGVSDNYNHIYIDAYDEQHSVEYFNYMYKSMGIQEYSYTGGPEKRLANVHNPALERHMLLWLNSYRNNYSIPDKPCTIYCGDGSDSINAGGVCSHVFVGGYGDDTFTAGSGNDEYCYFRGHGMDTIIDRAGYDKIKLYGFDSGTNIEAEPYGGYVWIYADSQPIIKISKDRAGGIFADNQFSVQVCNDKNKVVQQMQLQSSDWFEKWNGYRSIRVKCPVELDIYKVNNEGAEDELMLTVTNTSDDFIETDFGFFYNIPEYDEDGNPIDGQYEKQAILFDSDNYYVKIRGTEKGTMDLYVDWSDENASCQSSSEGISITSESSFSLIEEEKPVLVDDVTGEKVALNEQTESLVTEIELSDSEVSLVEDSTYQLSAKTTCVPANQDVTVYWTSSDSDICEVDENGLLTAKNEGTCTITVTDENENAEATVEVTVTAKPQEQVSITKAKVTGLTKLTYSGKAKKPSPKVTLKGKTLKKGTDYTLKYSNNINVGKASITITGKGKYIGKLKKTFKIIPKGTSLKTLVKGYKAITVKWNKQSTKMAKTRITGYQIQLATNSKFTKGKKTVTVSGYSKVSKKVTGLKAKKTYYVRIRTYKTVSGTKYYSKWSAKKSMKTK